MGIPLRVLIVEDSEDDVRLLARELKRGGYDVTHEQVDTAPAMQAALDRQVWDVVIGDFSMPKFSGVEALALVRERGLDVPYICVSGTITEDMAVAAMKAGANDWVTKGQLKRLVPAVDRELREAKGGAELRARPPARLCVRGRGAWAQLVAGRLRRSRRAATAPRPRYVRRARVRR